MDEEDFTDPTDDTASHPWWDNDDAVSSLAMERQVNPQETNEQLTRRLLDEAAPKAAHSIIQVALHSRNDNTRFAAARYITDLQLNPDTNSGAKAAWEKLVGDVVSEADLIAKGAAE